MKEIKLRKLQTVWFQWYEVLDKVKFWEQLGGQWQGGVKSKAQRTFRAWQDLEQYHTDEDGLVHICQNPHNANKPKNSPIIDSQAGEAKSPRPLKLKPQIPHMEPWELVFVLHRFGLALVQAFITMPPLFLFGNMYSVSLNVEKP